MWAMIPMFRVSASPASTVSAIRLPAVVGEGLVGLRHLVGVFAPLHSSTETVARVEQLVHEPLGHGLLASLAGVGDQPAERQGGAATSAHLDRDLVGGATDTTAAHLEGGLDVVQRPLERDDGVGTALLTGTFHGAVDDPLGDRLLAGQQDLVDQGGHQRRTVNGVDDYRVLRGGALARH